MSQPQEEGIVEARVLAANILTKAAQRNSEAMDRFSSWLMVGFGAAFALILTHLESIAKYVPIAHLRVAGILFLASAALGVVEKFFAAFVAAGASSAADGAVLGQEFLEKPVDVNEMIREVQRGLLWPWRAIARFMTDAALLGDHCAAGRVHTLVSQLQGYLVLIQALVALIAAGVVIYGITTTAT